jgi:hypothetical protein
MVVVLLQRPCLSLQGLALLLKVSWGFSSGGERETDYIYFSYIFFGLFLISSSAFYIFFQINYIYS